MPPTHSAVRLTEHGVRFWIALGGGIVALVLLLQSESFQQWMERATHWAEGLMTAHPVQGAVIFFVFSALSAMLAFTSSVVLVPPANLVWGKVVTFLLLWGGWIAGAMAAFGIGKLAEPTLRRLGYREKLQRYQQFVSKRMKFWVVLVFCMAVPSEVPGYLFGSMKYPFWKFVAAIGLAEAIYAVGAIVAGKHLLEARPGVVLTTVAIMIVIAVAAGWVLRIANRRRTRSKA